MYNAQFIQVKSLEGELLFSQKRNQLGCTLTTKELIIQQPHATYHMLLEDIIGMIPFQLDNPRSHIATIGEANIVTHFPKDYFKISVRQMNVIKRHGVQERKNTYLIVPLNKRFIEKLAEYDDFTVLPT